MKIRLMNVRKTYNQRTVLDIPFLELDENRIYALAGPNGSGKTTLLKLLAGVDRNYEGSILLEGREAPPEKAVAYLPQVPYLFNRTVLSNVMLGLDGDRSVRRRRAMDALEQVGMEGYAGALARKLSGGEAQRVAVARTLVLGRELAVLDEPTASVDVSHTRRVEQYIRTAGGRPGRVTVFSTHIPSQALRIADELLILMEGRVVERGTPREVLDSPGRQEVRTFLQDWRL